MNVPSASWRCFCCWRAIAHEISLAALSLRAADVVWMIPRRLSQTVGFGARYMAPALNKKEEEEGVGQGTEWMYYNSMVGCFDGCTGSTIQSLLSIVLRCATERCIRHVLLCTEIVAQHGVQRKLRIGLRSAFEAKCSFGCIAAGHIVWQCCRLKCIASLTSLLTLCRNPTVLCSLLR